MPLHVHFTWMQATIALLAMGAALVLCRKGYLRNPGRLTFWLECLRFVIVCFICLLLFQPEWIVTIPPRQSPEICIFYDASESMDTPDVVNGHGTITRREYVDRLLKDGLGKEFEGGNAVRIAPFSQAPAQDSPQRQLAVSDLASPLDDALKQSDNIRAIIILSDGIHNSDSSPLASVQKMRDRNIPLYAVPTGSMSPLPDVAITGVQAPTYGMVGEMVQIPFSIKNTLDRDIDVPLVLRALADGNEKKMQVRIPARNEISDSMMWKIPGKGEHKLELIVPLQQGELIAENNKMEFAVNGREESIKVLLIDSLPRWEYRFIRNALHRDPGVKLETLLIHPDLSIPGEGPGYLTQFPESLDHLSGYDVVFLGDVGLGKKGLSLHQASLLKGLIANQASGLVFLPGYQGNQMQLLDSDLSDLFPVVFERGMPGGVTSTETMTLTLTPEGRSSLLTLLADDEEENDLVWKSLPGFNWYAPVQRAKAGTQVLATNSMRKNKYGSIPLIVTQPYGNGKVLFMGIDSAWKWRKDVEDKYHYRFWGQVARWMSYRRNMAAGDGIRLMVTPERPRPGDTVNITAIVSDEQGSPLSKGDVYADIADPLNNTIRQQLTPLKSSWGAFSTSFKITSAGEWGIKCLSSASPGKPVSMNLPVIHDFIEKKGLPVNAELLSEMAAITNGRVASPDNIESLVTEIRNLPTPPPQEKRILLWCHPATLALFILLMSLFLAGRKLNGTI